VTPAIMRFLNVRGFTTSTTYPTGRHFVTLWEQPLHRWLMAQVYHWYDMRVYKLPGFRTVERWLERMHGDDELYVPLSARQDLRCWYLTEKQRTQLAKLDLPSDVAERVKASLPL
jgi:hypothetical protein